MTPGKSLASPARHFGDEHDGFKAYIDGRAERRRIEHLFEETPEEQQRHLGPMDDDAGRAEES